MGYGTTLKSENTILDNAVSSDRERTELTQDATTTTNTTKGSEETNECEFGYSVREYELINNMRICVEKETMEDKLHGYRIVNINLLLNQSVSLQHEHSRYCTGGKLQLHKEVRKGFCSTFIYKCNACEKEVCIKSDQDSTAINKAAVWGTLSTSSTYAHLAEFCSVLDIPVMSANMFFSYQKKFGNVFEKSLYKNMEAAGEKEYRLAVNKGDVDPDGVPHITVVVDGGWSKRSYGHSYTANSGVGVIIGRRTGKLLYVGVRNKYCSICHRAENKNETVGSHVCFKNWLGSSSSMESDIIAEGFNRSIEMHKLRYKRFVADGDSSVFNKIKERVPYGLQVQKIECTNHCVKNYTKHLYNIKRDTKGVAVETRKLLTKDIIVNLGATVQKAIYANAHGDIETLKEDIRNSVKHVFGDHTDCKEYLCISVGDTAANNYVTLRNSGGHHHIYGAINMLLSKTHLLIDNETSNRAELFMSILARFTMGKRINLSQRNSFDMRCHLAGMRFNDGPAWHTSAWRDYMQRSPPYHLNKYTKAQKLRAAKRKREDRRPKCRRQIKFCSSKNHDYGQNISEVMMSHQDLEGEVHKVMERLKISGKEEQRVIESQTMGQFSNPAYVSQKLHRLTASNFGAVIKRRGDTSCDALVRQILGKTSFSSSAIEYGKINESVALAKFTEETGKVVKKSGLFVDIQNGYLGASPDGVISDTEICEVKCLHKVAKLGLSLFDAVKSKQVPCLQITENNTITIKEQHNYYLQIQGQLAITGADVCQFIVYSGDRNNIFVEAIRRNESKWNNVWLPKLLLFYKDCVAPEIVLNRRAQNLKCRDPQYILLSKMEKEKQRNIKKRKQVGKE